MYTTFKQFMDKIINILVIEDEKRVADLISRGLHEMGYHVDLAYDAEEALSIFKNKSFHIILSDIILPGMNGLNFCQEVRTINKEIPIIMLTALGTTDDKLEGFDAGADDYMVKPFDLRELDGRIRVLLKRSKQKKKKKKEQLSYADLHIDLLTKTANRGSENIKLSPKEYNLLIYMMKNADRLLTRTEIADKVWDTHFDTGTNFIDVYINYLRKKIDKQFEVKLIHTKPGMGFIFTDKP